MSIVKYGAAIWGFKDFSCINAVHNRMCRYFLGVSKFTPNAAVQGDVGARNPWQHQRLEICRQWCRLSNMSDDRINKKVFRWIDSLKCKNWSHRIKQFLHSCNRAEYCNAENIQKGAFLKDMCEHIENINEETWLSIVNKESGKKKQGKNKLRTYNTFKQRFCSEPYVYMILPRSHRSAMAQFRCGTAPIRLETGRYEGLAVEARICPLCKNGVETELHVLLECPTYDEIRKDLFSKLAASFNGFYVLSKMKQLSIILSCSDEILVRFCAKACNDILTMRKQHLYN